MLPVIQRAAKILGDGRGTPNYTALADAVGCNRSSLYCWKRIPSNYVKKIVVACGGKITASQLRPDLFPATAAKQVPRKKNNGRRTNLRKRERGAAISSS